MGLYTLDDLIEGFLAREAAIKYPERYVLKPQREGGGNNLYRQKMIDKLQSMTGAERHAYILMERIPSIMVNEKKISTERRKVNDISDSTRNDPANLLTIGRTIMANERTLLAFLRTFMTFFIAGIGLVKYSDHPVFDTLGWIFIVLAGIFFIWGVHRYRHVRKVLRVVTPEDQRSAEKEMGL